MRTSSDSTTAWIRRNHSRAAHGGDNEDEGAHVSAGLCQWGWDGELLADVYRHCVEAVTVQKHIGKELDFYCHANKRAWMSKVIFFPWMTGYDSRIGRDSNWKVALSIDNCSAHGEIETVPTLPRITIILLPPNTTSKNSTNGCWSNQIREVEIQDRPNGTCSIYHWRKGEKITKLIFCPPCEH